MFNDERRVPCPYCPYKCRYESGLPIHLERYCPAFADQRKKQWEHPYRRPSTTFRPHFSTPSVKRSNWTPSFRVPDEQPAITHTFADKRYPTSAFYETFTNELRPPRSRRAPLLMGYPATS